MPHSGLEQPVGVMFITCKTLTRDIQTLLVIAFETNLFLHLSLFLMLLLGLEGLHKCDRFDKRTDKKANPPPPPKKKKKKKKHQQKKNN